MPKKYIFTLSTGRSGTAFLASLLEANLESVESHHEMLNFSSFDTPEISTYTLFNSKGNISKVKNFWKKKFGKIKKCKNNYYVETSHLLAKAGLLENIDILTKDSVVDIIILKRNILDTIQSFYNRNDFANLGNTWLWYLDPKYPKNIVPSGFLTSSGINGLRFWYILEIRARAYYYKTLFKKNKKVNFHEVDLERLSDRKKIKQLLNSLGQKIETRKVVITPKTNESVFVQPLKTRDVDMLKNFIKNHEKDSIKYAKKYIKSGKSF